MCFQTSLARVVNQPRLYLLFAAQVLKLAVVCAHLKIRSSLQKWPRRVLQKKEFSLLPPLQLLSPQRRRCLSRLLPRRLLPKNCGIKSCRRFRLLADLFLAKFLVGYPPPFSLAAEH